MTASPGQGTPPPGADDDLRAFRVAAASLAAEMHEWVDKPRGEMVRSATAAEVVQRWAGVLDLLARRDARAASDAVVMAPGLGLSWTDAQ